MSIPASAVILPADTIVPEFVKLPTTSTVVAVSSISVSAARSNCPSAMS